MSRLPRRPLARRLAALAVGTSLLTAAGIAATASSASADTVLNVHYALTGTVGGGGPISGSYTIPAFHHCLLNTLLLNLTIPGPGNTLNLTLGQLQLG